MSDGIFLTRDGRNKMIDELERLKKRKPQITLEIERAREHGDLRENAEYHAAKETLTKLGKRIADIEAKLSRARIIEEQHMDADKIYIGVTVTLKDSDGDVYEYTIVDVEEADPMQMKISVQSPLSQGLLGHKTGETVKVELPAGAQDFTIVKISR